MQKYTSVIAMMIAMVAIGCTANVQAPVTPVPVAPKVESKPKDDGFDKAGGMFADGSRYVWNETTHAYEWTKETVSKWNEEYNTEENRQKAADAATEAKDKTIQAYESLSTAIREAVNKDKCKCNAGDPLCKCL